MNITSAQYVKNLQDKVNHIKATIDGNLTFVPLDPDNTDYQAILEWAKEDGNEIQAAE
tara:strand:+ start:960 stop:1133 length:174 start_codon:yes stop_codon:yes gene_type:complete